MDLAKQILEQAKEQNVKFLLPVDHVVADKVELDAQIQTSARGRPSLRT